MNDTPVVVELDTQTTSEDTGSQVFLIASDVDIGTNDQSLTFTAFSSDESLVQVSTSDTGDSTATLFFDVQQDHNGSAEIMVIVVDDGDPVLRDTTVFTLVVTEVNDTPVADASSFVLPEDSSYTHQLTGNDGDTTATAADDQDLTYVIVDSTFHGVLVLNSETGLITFDPDTNYNGVDSFSFRVTDDGTTAGESDPLTSESAVVSITVQPVNDAPAITFIYPYPDTLVYANILGEKEVVLTARAYDFDSDTLIFSWYDLVADSLFAYGFAEIPPSDSMVIPLEYTFEHGVHIIQLVIEDNGEYNDNLSDTTSLSDDTLTVILVGFPSISTQRNQAFLTIGTTGDSIRSFLPITLTNGTVDSTINQTNSIRIYLPGLSPIHWTSLEQITVDDTSKIQLPPVSNQDSTQLLFGVKSTFYSTDTLTISGLMVSGFDTTFSPSRLRISVDGRVDYDSTNAENPFAFWIGNTQVDFQGDFAYVVGDTNIRECKPLVIWEDSQVSSVTADVGIHVRIPDSLYLGWNESLDGSDVRIIREGNDVTDSLFDSLRIDSVNRVLSIELQQDFEAGDSLILSGALFQDFDSIATLKKLSLSVVIPDPGNNWEWERETDHSLRIGDPSFYSLEDHILVKDLESTYVDTLNKIVINEHDDVAALQAEDGIFLRIPENLPLIWADTLEMIIYSGPVNGFSIVDSTILMIDLSRDLSPGESIVLRKLPITRIVSSVVPDTLKMSPNGGLSFNRSDTTASIRVGAPTIRSEEEQKFIFRDTTQILSTVKIKEDPAVSCIIEKYGVVLAIDDSFPVVFDSTQVLMDYYINDSLVTDSVFHLSQKLIRIDIKPIIFPGDSIVLDRIRVSGFTGRYDWSTCLFLSVRGMTRFTAIDSQRKGIGKPDVEALSKIKGLVGSVNSLQIPDLVIHEDPDVAVIDTNHRITLKLLESAPIYWQEVPALDLQYGYANLSPIPEFSPNLKEVYLSIENNFEPEDSVKIAGLRVTVNGETEDSLLFTLNDSTYQDTIKSWLTIGSVTFSSNSQIFFRGDQDPGSRSLSPFKIYQGSVELIDTVGLILRIPDYMNAEWDLVDPPFFSFTYTDTVTVGDTLSLSDNGKGFRISVSTFPTEDTLTISELRFAEFKASDSGHIQLVLDGSQNSLVIRDPFVKLVVGPDMKTEDGFTYVVGDTGELAALPTLIFTEDEKYPIISKSNVSIVLPPSVSWRPGTQTIHVWNQSLDDTITVATLNDSLIDLSDDLPDISEGDSLFLSGLLLDSIRQKIDSAKVSFKLQYSGDLSNGDTLEIKLEDRNLLRAGQPHIEIEEETYPINNVLEKNAPSVRIIESSVPVFGPQRQAVATVPEPLTRILKWIPSSEYNLPDAVASIAIGQDSLIIDFKRDLDSLEIVEISNLLLSSEGYFESGDYLKPDSIQPLVKSPLTLTHITKGIIRLNTIANTNDSIAVYPPLIFDSPSIVTENGVTKVNVPSFPGLLEIEQEFSHNGTRIFMKKTDGLQTSILDSLEDYSLTVSLETHVLPNGKEINVSKVSLELRESDQYLMNSIFDRSNRIDMDSVITKVVFHKKELQYSPDFSDEHSGPARLTDSSEVTYHYLPTEAQLFPRTAFVNNNSFNQLSIRVDTTFPDTITLALRNSNNDTIIDTNVVRDSSHIMVYPFIDFLEEDIYMLSITGQLTDSTLSFPIIRQFIVDTTSPTIEFDSTQTIISTITAEGKDGFGHQLAGGEKLNARFTDNVFIDSLGTVVLQDTILNPYEFYLVDSVKVTYMMEWGAEDYQFLDTLTQTIKSHLSESEDWTVTSSLDSLIFTIIDTTNLQKKRETREDELHVRLTVQAEDQATNTNSTIVIFSVLLDPHQVVGSEIFNYPNPFSHRRHDGTRIRYVLLQEKDDGEIVIVDAGGEIVFHYELSPTELQVGTHEVIWDGTNFFKNELATGVYFGFIKIGDSFNRIKIVILN